MSTPVSAIASTLENAFLRQRAAYFRDPYPNAAQRRAQLERLIRTVLTRQDEIASALDRDFGGRSKAEVRYAEILTSLRSLRHARRHLKGWMKSWPAPVPLPFQMARAWVMPQPLGVVGIVVPWNYPLYLTMGPLAAALAAGNRVILKLSEFAPATSSVLAALFVEAFPEEVVTVAEGDAEVAKAFVRLPFDHLLFTGSVAVGRQVMREASANLTPVTLELGGKSPVLLGADAILPVKPYRTLEDAIRYINDRPRPLALYLFTRNSQVMDDVLKRTTSGGVAINDTLLQIAIEDLPAGGVGASGMGHYHGLFGFETFSKLKPVFRRADSPSPPLCAHHMEGCTIMSCAF